jgi:hypothetical protein
MKNQVVSQSNQNSTKKKINHLNNDKWPSTLVEGHLFFKTLKTL